MINPRRTRLLRVPSLRSFQRAIADVACHADPHGARACAVLVPTHAAAEQLRRTLETLILDPSRAGPRPTDPPRAGHDGHGTPIRAMVLPELLTRDDWYAGMHARLGRAPQRLTPFERDVLLRAAARTTLESGVELPFQLRPGVLAALLEFYDTLRRQHRSSDAFERLMSGELESNVEFDRGARRLLGQTKFLAATFRHFEQRVAASGRLDEHRLRELLLATPCSDPLRHVVVTVADQAAASDGLWLVDFDLLARLPSLQQVDVIATEALLAAGFHDRVHELLPGIEEERLANSDDRDPCIVTPPATEEQLHFSWRDREEELLAIARYVKQSRGSSPTDTASETVDDRVAVVFQRPLPYIYLARQVFEACGIPFQAFDALPLAAEPYAAAVDLVFDVAVSRFARSAIVALLRSPHFDFVVDGRRVSAREITALDHQLRAARYLGGRDEFVRLVEQWEADVRGGPSETRALARRAARAVLDAADELQPLTDRGAASRLLDTMLSFLSRHDVRIDGMDDLDRRQSRARAAIRGAIRDLGSAHAEFDDPICDPSDVRAAIRRWIEGRTFDVRAGRGGIQLVDAQAASYGSFARIAIVGLVEDEWPQRRGRSIFYPASLLRQLGWSGDAGWMRAARARFYDLLRLPTEQVMLSTFVLEDDAIVGPSMFIEELPDAGLMGEPVVERPGFRVSVDEAMTLEPVVATAVSGEAALWLSVRMARETPRPAGHVGAVEPRTYSVSAVERYVACPFKYFAADVLDLDEEDADEAFLTPRVRGHLLHEIFRRFFEDWQRVGRGAVDADNLDEALRHCTEVADAVLARLPESERALERTQLLGSVVAPSLVERLLRLEAENPDPVVERLLEHRLDGQFVFTTGPDVRPVTLSGIVDRLDLLQNGTLRLVDYKLGRSPKLARAIQLPVYAVCAEQRLAGRHGRRWTIAEAAYIAFGESRLLMSLASTRRDLASALVDGQERFLEAVSGIERGEFPVRPVEPYFCSSCGFAEVCRKDYVGEP